MKSKSVYIFLALTPALLLAALFSGVHTFFCFLLGFLWGFYLCNERSLQEIVLFGRWKMTYGRYSFVRLLQEGDRKLNQYFNPRRVSFLQSLLRLLFPAAIFFVFDLLLPFSVEWYFILAGGITFEAVHFLHNKIKDLT